MIFVKSIFLFLGYYMYLCASSEMSNLKSGGYDKTLNQLIFCYGKEEKEYRRGKICGGRKL